MDSKADHVPAEGLEIGLDRSTINQDGQIQLPHDDNIGSAATHNRVDNSATVGRTAAGSDLTRSPTNKSDSKLKQKTHNAALKIREKLHIKKASDDVDPEERTVLARDADEDNDDARLVHQLPKHEKPTLKDLAHNPVETIKSKVSNEGNHQVAANIAAKEVPHGQEVEIVKAATAVNRARTEKEKLLAIQDLNKLMSERQSTMVRWTLDRHVTKLRVLPRDTVVMPNKADYKKITKDGIVTDWHAYGAKVELHVQRLSLNVC